MSERTPDHAIDPLFAERWSPRAFTGETLDEATLLRFLEAARWAPSGQPLSTLVAEGRFAFAP